MIATRTMTEPMTLYLGGKMLGRKGFGSADFDHAAAVLRALPWVKLLFNPAENDRENGFHPELLRGTQQEMDDANFSRRNALHQDSDWIHRWSNGMVVLRTWRSSDGTFEEMAIHQGLKLPVWRYGDFIRSGGDPAKLAAFKLPSLREICAGVL
jgi:hypothetical protein